jgi:hypothetical protein
VDQAWEGGYFLACSDSQHYRDGVPAVGGDQLCFKEADVVPLVGRGSVEKTQQVLTVS